MAGREGFSFGNLVVVASDPAGGTGIVADARKSDCRVLYIHTGRSAWAPHRELRHARSDETDGTLEQLVSDTLALLGALEMEFDAPGAGRFVLKAAHGAVTPETIDRMRTLLGPRLRACLIRPQGMHRIQTLIDLSWP